MILAEPQKRERWPEARQKVFDHIKPAALVLVAADGPEAIEQWRHGEPYRIGGNRGLWPARLAETRVWHDTITHNWDKSPYRRQFMGAQFRMWTLSTEERARLAASVVDLMRAEAEDNGSAAAAAELRPGFFDLGPDLDLDMFRFRWMDIAGNLRVRVWDDADFVYFLDRVVTRWMRARAAARGFRRDDLAIDAAVAAELEVRR